MYNLGTGNGYSVLQVIKAFDKACGRDLPYEIQGRRAGDIATCYADATQGGKGTWLESNAQYRPNVCFVVELATEKSQRVQVVGEHPTYGGQQVSTILVNCKAIVSNFLIRLLFFVYIRTETRSRGYNPQCISL